MVRSSRSGDKKSAIIISRLLYRRCETRGIEVPTLYVICSRTLNFYVRRDTQHQRQKKKRKQVPNQTSHSYKAQTCQHWSQWDVISSTNTEAPMERTHRTQRLCPLPNTFYGRSVVYVGFGLVRKGTTVASREIVSYRDEATQQLFSRPNTQISNTKRKGKHKAAAEPNFPLIQSPTLSALGKNYVYIQPPPSSSIHTGRPTRPGV